jgi:hypothetical protein
MASNQRKLVKRVIEMKEIAEPIYGQVKVGKKTVTRVVATRRRRIPVWHFGIFETSNSMSGRTQTAVVEGTYQDAVRLSKASRTESGHSFKGFKRLKDVS